MGLRSQLLLVSLFTLLLPWAGCQYIQEMDRVLRQGQAASLEATAQAVAARLGAEPNLLPPRQEDTAPEQQLYAHRLPHAAIVDGYDDEWRNWGFEPRYFHTAPESGFSLAVTAGVHGDQLYLLFQVDTPRIDYHHPGRPELASGDHLLLAADRYYVITTSAPGMVTAGTRDANGLVRREHHIRGYWQEHGRGYQVELQLPLSLVQDGFALGAVDAEHRHLLGTLPVEARWATQVAYHRNLPPPPGHLVHPQRTLEDALSVFAQPGLRLRVLDIDRWQLADAGRTDDLDEEERGNWLLNALYRAALSHRPLTPYQAQRNGRPDNPAITAAYQGQVSTYWQQLGRGQLASASAPIRTDNGRLAGAVLVEQSGDILLPQASGAFSRLLLVGMGTAFTVGLVLLSYASWLSWRIRRLSRTARDAVAPDGQITVLDRQWPSSRSGDEIGDLSRNYHSLLQRLQGYTDYLKTLTGKLSHELRTPLAVVRSSLDNLEHQPLEESGRVYAERASEGAERLSRLLTAMSEASRVESSIASAERETLALDRLLRDIGAAYADVYPRHQILVDIAPAPPEYYRVEAAPDLLAQLLDKLVDNATDFCPPGGEIRLSLEPRARCLVLSVVNEGPPLPETMREQLFDSLVSVRPSGGERAHLGLGLHIVQLIARYHGGTASAANRPDGRGVVFSLTLPAGRPKPEKSPPGVDTAC